MKFLINITHYNETEVPAKVTLDQQFILDISQKQMAEIEKQIDQIFHDVGDDSEYHSITVTKINSVEKWTPKKLDKWLEDYKEANVGSDESEKDMEDDEDDEDEEPEHVLRERPYFDKYRDSQFSD